MCGTIKTLLLWICEQTAFVILNKVTFGTISWENKQTKTTASIYLSCQFMISLFGASGSGDSEVETHCCLGFTPVVY